jgi:hypothetical protein
MSKDLAHATGSTLLPAREAALLMVGLEALEGKAPTELRPIGHLGAK